MDFARIGAGQKLQGFFQSVTRDCRAFTVIEIFQRTSPRSPCEQNQRSLKAGIMRKLGESHDAVRKAGIVAMHEQQDIAVTAFPCCNLCIDRLRENLTAVEISTVANNEMPVRRRLTITRTLQSASLVTWRYGNKHSGMIKAGAFPGEKLVPFSRTGARGRHKNVFRLNTAGYLRAGVR